MPGSLPAPLRAEASQRPPWAVAPHCWFWMSWCATWPAAVGGRGGRWCAIGRRPPPETPARSGPPARRGDGGRTISRSWHEDMVESVRAYHATSAYEQAMRWRQVWPEPLFAEAKQWHGLQPFRLRGLEKVNVQGLLVAADQNLKRWLPHGTPLRPVRQRHRPGSAFVGTDSPVVSASSGRIAPTGQHTSPSEAPAPSKRPSAGPLPFINGLRAFVAVCRIPVLFVNLRKTVPSDRGCRQCWTLQGLYEHTSSTGLCLRRSSLAPTVTIHSLRHDRPIGFTGTRPAVPWTWRSHRYGCRRCRSTTRSNPSTSR